MHFFRKLGQVPANKGGIHHLATNKNDRSILSGGPWTPRFRELFRKAGLGLEDAANKIRIPGHHGPHPEAYHQAVYRRLVEATEGLSGAAYRDALLKALDELGIESITPGTFLNNLLTQ